MRRLLAACGAAVLSLAVFVPVAQAAAPDGKPSGQQVAFYTPVKWDDYGAKHDQPATAPDGATVSSTDQIVTVSAKLDSYNGTTSGGVMSWDVRIVPDSGGPASTCHEDITPVNNVYNDQAYIACPWDTTEAVDLTATSTTSQVQVQTYSRNWHVNDHGPSVNGRYSIQVTVTSAGQCRALIYCGPDSHKVVTYELYEDPGAQRWRQVFVTNGVAAPTGVNATFDQASNRINVTWARNPEPDVTYLVQEKVGDGGWAPVGTVPASATNFVRSIAQPGKYQYQVAAMRPAPTGDNSSATVTSKYVAAQVVTVNAVSPPTTAAAGSPGAAATGAGPDAYIDHSGDNGVTTTTGAPPPAAAGSHVPGSAKGASAAGHSTGSKSGGAAAGGESEGEGPDSGFSSTLPYSQGGAADGLGSGDSESPGGESMTPLVNVPRPQDARAFLIPLAGALAMFVLAAQGMYLLRRRAPITAGGPAVEDDFDDWMGY